MEALAVLRLSVSPRRNNAGHGYLEDDDDIALPTPYTSAPSSPRRAFVKAEVEEAPLGEVRAAVPFVWEVIPGTPKNDLESGPVELSVSSYETEESGCQDHGSSSSPGGSEATESTLSRDSSNTEFEFSSRFVGIVEPLPCRAAEELFSNGQLLPLRLPPRLQAVKHLRNSDSSCSDSGSSSGESFQSYHSSQSPRIVGSPKKISLCGFTKTTEETTILGMQEGKQRPRSLSPLRLFNRDSSAPARSNFSSETCSSSDSVSSASASSSSKTNADSPQDSPDEKNIVKGSTLKDLLLTDMAMASTRIENWKIIAKPRQVQSRLELLKKQQEQWNGFPDAEKIDGTPALTPQLSRSNARSRTSIDTHVKSLQKENVGRAIFANRFGMLCSCLGILPESP